MENGKGPLSMALNCCLSIGVLLLLISFLVTGDRAGANCFASPTTVTITQPDGYDDGIAEGDDFATVVLGDPWDMAQLSDIVQPTHIDSISLSDGILSGFSTSNDPYFWVLHPGYPSVQNIGKNGTNYPIDASRYTRLSFRLWLPPGTDSYAVIYWNRLPNPAVIAGLTGNLPVSGGWHLYTIHLPQWVMQGSWSGQITGLRIDPCPLSGITFKLDWVRLTSGDSSPAYTIRWTAQNAGTESVDLYCDDDNRGYDGERIASGLPAGQEYYSWNNSSPLPPVSLGPGRYYIYGQLSSGAYTPYSPGPVTMNQAPILRILAPSMTSGEDYAATMLGDPWDMNNPEDIVKMTQIARFYFADGIFHATTTGEHNPWGDPTLLLPVSESAPIDTSRYKYLTWRMWHEGEQDVGNGWTARYLWAKTALGSDHSTSDDFVILEGWNTYKIDLSKALLEPGSPNLGWTESVREFRFDPTEVPAPATFHLDYIHLRAVDRADHSFHIIWELIDPDSTCTVSLYYDIDRAGFDGQLIAILTDETGTGSASLWPRDNDAFSAAKAQLQQEGVHRVYLPLVVKNLFQCPGACYNWNTVSVPAGEYYIYAVVEDGYNITRWYSETPVIISH